MTEKFTVAPRGVEEEENNDDDDDNSRLEEVREIGADKGDEKQKKKSAKEARKKAKKEKKKKGRSSDSTSQEQQQLPPPPLPPQPSSSSSSVQTNNGNSAYSSVPQYATSPEVDMRPGVDPEMPEFLMSIDMQPQAGSVQVINTKDDGEISIVSLPYSDEFVVTGYESMLPKAAGPAPWYVSSGGIQACDENGEPMPIYYFVGIIDILMFYTPRKVAERIYKRIRYYGQGEVSSCPPPDYAKRFYEFMERYIE